MLLILYADTSRTQCSTEAFSVVGVVFEAVSAFGNVCLTLSMDALSTAAFLSPFSKVVLMALMFLGRMKTVPDRSEANDVALYEEWGEPAVPGDDSAAAHALLELPTGESLSGHVFTIGQGFIAEQQLKKRSALVGAFATRKFPPNTADGGCATTGSLMGAGLGAAADKE